MNKIIYASMKKTYIQREENEKKTITARYVQ